jgi:hypothetical protein
VGLEDQTSQPTKTKEQAVLLTRFLTHSQKRERERSAIITHGYRGLQWVWKKVDLSPGDAAQMLGGN